MYWGPGKHAQAEDARERLRRLLLSTTQAPEHGNSTMTMHPFGS